MTKFVLGALKQFASNLKTIIFALILSVIAWFAISFQLFPNIIKNIDLPVSANLTAYMIDENLTLSEEYNGAVTLRIEGKRYEIGNLSSDDFDAYLDFSDVSGPGEYTAKVVFQQREDVNCRMLNENEETKTVLILQNDQATLDVELNLLGVTATEGMQIDKDNAEVNPAVVTVKGERSLIASIDRAEVVAVESVVLTATSDLRGVLAFYDKYGNKIDNSGIVVDNEDFTLTVPVFKQKTLPLEVLISVQTNSNFYIDSLLNRLNVDPEELTISSPDFSIDLYEKWDIGTIPLNEISLTDLQKGCSVPIELPEGYVNLSGKSTALLTFDDVDDYGQMVFEVSDDNFYTINTPTGYDVNYITKQIAVTVVGPSSFIKSMSSSDINITINLAGITDISEGLRSIGANFRITGTDVEAWVFGEYKIDIELVNTQ